MYGIGGERVLEEQTLDHLTGYEGARPVRIGNDAYRQRQNDVFGAVLDSLGCTPRSTGTTARGCGRSSTTRSSRRSRPGGCPTRASGSRAATPSTTSSSKLMCWVALDRGARLAARRGKDDLADRWREVANEIHAEILRARRRRERALHAVLRLRRTSTPRCC